MGPIGVLCLQGDFREHVEILNALGVETRKVKLPNDLQGVSGLVIPGGESTVIDKLARLNGVFQPIRKLIQDGMPVFGTCAGLILLANRITDGIVDQQTFGGLDIEVQRNAFGSQVDSFQTRVDFLGKEVAAAFIRAPIVRQLGEGVQVTSALPDGVIVGVQQGNLLGISFHPELVGETTVHQHFIDLCRKENFVAGL